MKDILGHRSWNRDEVLAILDKGSFTMCSLPHYRFRRVRMTCHLLERCGLIKRTGKTDVSINFTPTDAYHEYRKNGSMSLEKLYKLQNPPVSRKKKCIQCGGDFETFNRQQKFCQPHCKSAHNLAKRSAA